MSFGSFLGKIGKGVVSVVKGVGIAGGNIVGGVVGVPGAGSALNAAFSKTPPNATGGAVTGSIDGSLATNPYVAPSSTGVATSSPSLLGKAGDLVDALTGLALGKNHLQVDGNIGYGNRVGDVSPNSSGLPSWLLPAGLAAGGLLLFTSMSGKRR